MVRIPYRIELWMQQWDYNFRFRRQMVNSERWKYCKCGKARLPNSMWCGSCESRIVERLAEVNKETIIIHDISSRGIQ